MKGLHRGGGGALHGPDVLQDQLCGHRPGGDHTVDHPRVGHQVHQGFPVDFRHHLAAVPRLLGGAHGHEDIGLVHTGDGHEGVGLLDALLLEQLAVGAVAHDHQGPGQLLAHLDAPLLILVDDPHGHPHLQQLGGQVIADLAGAHDHHGGRPVPEHAQVAEELLQLPGRGGEVDLVPRLQLKVAGGNDGLPLAGHGADQHPHLDVLIQIRKAHAAKGGFLRQPVFHQLQPALGERLHLHGRGEPQHPGDLPGRRLFRGDGHTEAQLVPHEAQLLLVLRVPHPGDGVLHTQLLGHQAGQNIDLVIGDGGDQQLRLVHLRLLLHGIAGAVSADSHHVIDVDDIFNQVWVLVDDGDLVVHGQMPRQCHAHLSRAHDHDLHNVRPFSCREIPISAQSQHIITDMPANAISFFVNFLRVCPPGAVTSLNNVRCACGCFLPAPPDSPKILLDKPAQTA